MLTSFQVFDSAHPVYCIKSVAAIPLIEDRAKVAVNTIASRNAALLRPSLLPRNTNPTDSIPDFAELPQSVKGPSTRVVQFSDDNQVKSVSPLSPQEFKLDEADDDAVASSGTSTPSFDDPVNMASVAKVVASRLSFWNKLSKRTRVLPIASGEHEPLTAVEQQETLDSLFDNGGEEPEEALDSILEETAPQPATSEEQHSQLEDKIVRECIREYTKGGMYFAYTFGKSHFVRSNTLFIFRHPRHYEITSA